IIAVPYKGSGPAAAAVAAGQVQAGFVWLPSVAGMVSSGQVRLLAIATAQRLPVIKDVPTLAELGYKNFEHTAFVGVLAPRGTPASVIAIVNKALNDSIQHSPTFAKRMEPFGMTLPAQPNTPQAYHKFMADQIDYQRKLAALAGAKPQ